MTGTKTLRLEATIASLNASDRRRFAEDCDAADPLREFRDRFVLPERGIYLDGNSLGPLAHATERHVVDLLKNQWGQKIVAGWTDGWIKYPRRLGAKIAKLIGAKANEVIVCDSTSVNFYKLAEAALAISGQRKELVTDDDTFPTNGYLLQHKGAVRYVSFGSGDIEAALTDQTALLALNHVNYKTAWMHDAGLLAQAAQKAGALTLWDLSHSVGVVPIQLNAWNVDMAVGCTYKYLNGGPGAPAFLYVREELQERLKNPIQGWWGHKSPFAFERQFEASPAIDQFLTGTPSILSMAAIDSSLDIVIEAGIERIRTKSIELTDFAIALWRDRLESLGLTLGSPTASENRGSHVAFGHDSARAIVRCLSAEFNVTTDFRPPNIVRFGLAPLYNSFSDVYEAVELLAKVVTDRSYLAHIPPTDPTP